jgi:methyl-accepting chemotaxis protein
MSLLNKMIVFGSVFLAVMCGIGGFAYMTVDGVRDMVRALRQDSLPIQIHVVRISTNHLNQVTWFHRGMIATQSNDSEAVAEAIQQFESYTETITEELDALEEQLKSTGASDVAALTRTLRMQLAQRTRNIRSYQLEWSTVGIQALSDIQSSGLVNNGIGNKELQTRLDRLSKILSDTISDAEELVLKELERGSAIIDTLIIQMILVCVVCVTMMLLIGTLITRQVLTQLGSDPATLAAISEEVAAGRLDMPLGSNQVGVLHSIISIVENLREVIGRIKMSASEVSQASTQVGTGNINLSQRIQEQASSLEEVAASMEEMTGTVNQNAENAVQANKLALEARDQAVAGGEVSGRTVTAMNEISASSRKIADIISVIDDIAFQTNLLALNAAVEAARAGEQGRGFAVVASEVRSLAGRSATAAKEIKELILDSVRKVEDGTKLVDESGVKLDEIVGAVIKVSDNVAEIASASQEQSDGIAQVNKAVAQMDDMTQENASLVEETAAASETVDTQARELRELMTFFHVGDDHEKTFDDENPRKFRFTPAPLEQHGARSETTGKAHAGLLSSDADARLNDDSNWEEF